MNSDDSSVCFHYLIALGSNMGDRQQHMNDALVQISKLCRTIQASAVVETDPLVSTDFDTKNHSPYLNQVIHICSEKNPSQLILDLQNIEDSIGHDRSSKWLPRAMDLDILFCEFGSKSDVFFQDFPVHFQPNCGLKVPHPGFWNRPFLIELCASIGIDIESLGKRNATLIPSTGTRS